MALDECAYGFDRTSNLITRQDLLIGVLHAYEYDSAYRLVVSENTRPARSRTSTRSTGPATAAR